MSLDRTVFTMILSVYAQILAVSVVVLETLYRFHIFLSLLSLVNLGKHLFTFGWLNT
jgi:hypothetical protein